MKTGIELITEERARQVSQEGWTPEHDDDHDMSELAMAAACYAVPNAQRGTMNEGVFARLWPWARAWWKPTPDDRVRELTKAGALIAAEIDRLQRDKLRARGEG